MPRSPSTREQRQGFWTGSPQLPGLPGFAGKLIPMAEVRELYERTCSAPDGFRLGTLLGQMQVDLEIQPPTSNAFRQRAARGGSEPSVRVLDGQLWVLLSRVRPDVRLMTNALLGGIPELPALFLRGPFHRVLGGKSEGSETGHQWLRKGGALAVFPAGEFLRWNGEGADRRSRVERDSRAPCEKQAAHSRLFLRTHTAFPTAGSHSPRLRTLVLMQNFFSSVENAGGPRRTAIRRK